VSLKKYFICSLTYLKIFDAVIKNVLHLQIGPTTSYQFTTSLSTNAVLVFKTPDIQVSIREFFFAIGSTLDVALDDIVLLILFNIN